MAKDISWAAWPVLWPSSCSQDRRLSSFAAKPSISLAASSEPNVRPTPSTLFQARRQTCNCRLPSSCLPNLMADRLRNTVKYLAYLRKMTRYNPTRGGTLPSIFDCGGCKRHASRHRLIGYSRTVSLPCSIPYLLQSRPGYDPTQDRPWCGSHGASEGF